MRLFIGISHHRGFGVLGLQYLIVLSRLHLLLFEVFKGRFKFESGFGLSRFHWFRLHFQEWHELPFLFWFCKKIVSLILKNTYWTQRDVAIELRPTHPLRECDFQLLHSPTFQISYWFEIRWLVGRNRDIEFQSHWWRIDEMVSFLKRTYHSCISRPPHRPWPTRSDSPFLAPRRMAVWLAWFHHFWNKVYRLEAADWWTHCQPYCIHQGSTH